MQAGLYFQLRDSTTTEFDGFAGVVHPHPRRLGYFAVATVTPLARRRHRSIQLAPSFPSGLASVYSLLLPKAFLDGAFRRIEDCDMQKYRRTVRTQHERTHDMTKFTMRTWWFIGVGVVLGVAHLGFALTVGSDDGTDSDGATSANTKPESIATNAEETSALSSQARQSLSVPSYYRAGTPIPMLIGMHGYGSVPEDFGNAFRSAADTTGMALLAVSATSPRGANQFVWREDVEADTKRLEASVATVSNQVTPKDGQIYLIGFSQGGQLALEIAAKHPERYAGAIAMSPGTRTPLERIAFGSKELAGHRFVVVVGEKEHPDTLAAAKESIERLKQFGAIVYFRVYAGVTRHAFPSDFREMLPLWLEFLKSEKSVETTVR